MKLICCVYLTLCLGKGSWWDSAQFGTLGGGNPFDYSYKSSSECSRGLMGCGVSKDPWVRESLNLDPWTVFLHKGRRQKGVSKSYSSWAAQHDQHRIQEIWHLVRGKKEVEFFCVIRSDRCKVMILKFTLWSNYIANWCDNKSITH